MTNIQVPELWRIMSSKYEDKIYKSPFLPKNDVRMYKNNKNDIYATKDGYMKFTLDKRLESKIITKHEYDSAIKNYNNTLKYIQNSNCTDSKIKRYLYHNRLQIPNLLNSRDIANNIANLSDIDKRVLEEVIKFQEDIKKNLTDKQLLTYNDIGFIIYGKPSCGLSLMNNLISLCITESHGSGKLNSLSPKAWTNFPKLKNIMFYPHYIPSNWRNWRNDYYVRNWNNHYDGLCLKSAIYNPLGNPLCSDRLRVAIYVFEYNQQLINILKWRKFIRNVIGNWFHNYYGYRWIRNEVKHLIDVCRITRLRSRVFMLKKISPFGFIHTNWKECEEKNNKMLKALIDYWFVNYSDSH